MVLYSTFTHTLWFSSAFLKNLLFGLTFSSLLVLEDRIIHIKSGEILELFGVFLIFHTRAFGAYGLNVR